jgi:Fe-S-cluster containining protein
MRDPPDGDRNRKDAMDPTKLDPEETGPAPDDEPDAPEESDATEAPGLRIAVAEDVEGGLRFLHLMMIQSRAQLSELTATVNALTEQLVVQGALPMEQFHRRRYLTVLRENERIAAEDATIEVSEAADKYALTNLPDIDCEARIPLCGARCCMSDFLLSVQDLDERVVRWEYARPYRVAQRAEDGHCVHNDPGSGACAVYDQRPAACRVFDCRNDPRIWIDFDRRIPAP